MIDYLFETASLAKGYISIRINHYGVENCKKESTTAVPLLHLLPIRPKACSVASVMHWRSVCEVRRQFSQSPWRRTVSAPTPLFISDPCTRYFRQYTVVLYPGTQRAGPSRRVRCKNFCTFKLHSRECCHAQTRGWVGEKSSVIPHTESKHFEYEIYLDIKKPPVALFERSL